MHFTSLRKLKSKKRRFCDLPDDLHRLVFQCSDPVDLDNLGKTCKLLHSLASERITWLNALKNVVAMNEMLIPPNTIEQCSVGELKYAATAPSRMLSLILEYPLLEKDPSKILVCCLATPEPLHDLFLVPGGCYLVALQDGRLDIWEMTVTRIPTNRVIASGVCGQNARNILSVARGGGSGPRGFRVAAGDKAAFYDTRIHIYEYRHGISDLPLIAELPTRGIITASALRGNICSILTDECLVVWDFVNGSYVSWPINPDDSFDKIILHENHLALSGTKFLNIWELPHLQPSPGRVDRPPPFTSEPRPPPDIEYLKAGPGGEPGENCYSAHIHDWYNTTPEDLLVDTISNARLTRYRYRSSQDHDKTALSENIIELEHLGLRDAPVNTLKDHRLCNDFIVIGFNNDDSEAQVLVVPINLGSPNIDNPANPSVAKAVLLSSRVQDERWSFDPTSGRLAYLDASEPNSQTIYVVDLLKALENGRRKEAKCPVVEHPPSTRRHSLVPSIIREWLHTHYLELKNLLSAIWRYFRNGTRNSIVN